MNAPRRYALCGLSKRGLHFFALPLLGLAPSNDASNEICEQAELVAIVDADRSRVEQFLERCGLVIPFYSPDEFDRMVRECRPDRVLVATPDNSHSDYAIAALGHDLDVIVEKPMAANCVQVRAMLDAEARSKGRIRVTHNQRYTPKVRQVKGMILDGAIGKVVSCDLLWSVDTMHGSSFFYRWNRQRANSGGLSVTKSCHHLDMANWLIGAEPEEVYAYGALNYYGPKSPHRPVGPNGAFLEGPAERLASPYYKRWFGDGAVGGESLEVPGWELGYDVQYGNEHPLYIFDEEIDVEDTYSAIVRYDNGASLSYAATWSGPWEGYRLGVNGTHGRIEVTDIDFRGTPSDPELSKVVYYPMFGEPTSTMSSAENDDVAADQLLRRELFGTESELSRRLGAAADSWQGALAVATGEAIWRAVQDRRPISVRELIGARRPKSATHADAD